MLATIHADDVFIAGERKTTAKCGVVAAGADRPPATVLKGARSTRTFLISLDSESASFAITARFHR